MISLIAILPGTFVYSSLGSIAVEVSKFNQVIENREDLGSFILSLLGIISTIVIVLLLLRSVKQSLEKDSN